MNKPLLIFPRQVQNLPRTKNSPTPASFSHPSTKYQTNRFDQKISSLDVSITNESMKVSETIEGLEPERTLVFEIKGTIDEFYKAVDKTEGMEFLGESIIGEEEYDEVFYFEKFIKETKTFQKDEKRLIPKKIFITINNYNSITELKKYWNWFKQGKNKEFKSKRVTKFRYLFEQLNDIRDYSVKDRYENTGILEDFKDRLARNETEMYFEIELSYRNDKEYLRKVYDKIKLLIAKCNGQIIEKSKVVIDEIKYFAVIAKAPISLFNDLKEDSQIPFFKCEQILFFRPTGQSIKGIYNDSNKVVNNDLTEIAQNTTLNESPVVALFDGLPLQNHVLLQNKLIIDDPEGIEATYPSNARTHGTDMASLILYGDLNGKNIELLSRKIYVRPILYAIFDSYHKNFYESIPNDRLFIDILHSAVKRIFEADGNEKPKAPDTKIINLSIGDYNRQFLFNNSSWARLIDWLSVKYNVLFIISTGNYTNKIEINLNGKKFDDLSNNQKDELFLKNIIIKNSDRKILAPAESVNSITVGAFSSDDYPEPYLTNSTIVELISTQDQISPYSRLGLGFLRGIKPDILMKGGRQLYRKNPVSNTFEINNSELAPGLKSAFPDSKNSNAGLHFTRGTSNAAALASRFGARIHHVLEDLKFENLTIPNEYLAVLIKSLLVHGASKEGMQLFIKALGDSNKTKLLPYIGHGLILNEEKVLGCTEQQVTLIGYGQLSKEGSHVFELPLPNEISSMHVSKQLTITLAWFTPINFSSNKYRKTTLYIDNINGKNSLSDEIEWDTGNEYDYKASQKGSVQHLRYIGTGADAYIEDSILKIKVNCREEASGFTENVKYGLAVTFELLGNSTIEIYDTIRQRIAQKIRISQI